MGRYKDRRHAGRVLAEALRDYAGRPDVVVLALPRGGVPVAYEVARRLGAPLDVFVVRKLGLPGHEEFAMGALASGGVIVVDRPVIQSLGISSGAIEAAIAREQAELARRERLYRGDRPPLDVTGKTVILVDDGLATGSTMRAAVAGLRQRGARRIVVGVPIASPDTCEALAPEVDDIVCAATPEPFVAVGLWYENFEQTSDEEVRQLLETAERELGERGHGATPAQGP